MAQRDEDPDLWVLSFRPAPGFTAPMAVRVKRLLKAALRAFGLRCVKVSGREPLDGAEIRQDDQDAAGKQ